jgi:hypothetical protein
MQLDPQLRERILRSLRWLTADAEHRFNDCKGNADGFEGGYSPELKEAIALRNELEQGELPMQMNALAPPMFTEQECVDMGASMGMPYKQAIEFYLHYGKQGWLLGNGLPIVNLRLAMRNWQVKQQEKAEKRETQGGDKITLYPLKPPKNCSEHGCNVPAVHKVVGAYDFWYCKKHIPKKDLADLREQGYDV